MNQNALANPPDSGNSHEVTRLAVNRMQDVILARFVGREEAVRMGFQPEAVTEIATAISEITRNVVQHAGAPGRIRLFVEQRADRLGLKILVEDAGKGIEHIERLEFDSAAAFGAGIPGARRLMDEFQLESRPGATALTMVKWLPPTSAAS